MSVSSPQEPVIEDGLVSNMNYTDHEVIGYSDPNPELLQAPATLLPVFCSPFHPTKKYVLTHVDGLARLDLISETKYIPGKIIPLGSHDLFSIVFFILVFL